MSNYPPPSPYLPGPYATPGGYLPPPGMTAARRAGVLMIVVGVLMMLGGGCFTAFGAMLPQIHLPPETAEQFHQIEVKSGISLSVLARGVMVMGAIGIAMGIYQIVIGVFIRGGGRGPAITALVTTVLLLLMLLLTLATNVLSGDPTQLASAGCTLVVGGSLIVWQLLWLIAAVREASRRSWMLAQYQSQYWQYQQQQQAYQQPYPPPYGYPPPPPASTAGGWAYASPPPPPPDNPPPGPTQHYPSGDENKT